MASDDAGVLDSATRYVSENVNEDISSRMTTAQVFDSYVAWCQGREIEPIGTKATFGKLLKKEGLPFTRFKKDGKTHRGWKVST